MVIVVSNSLSIGKVSAATGCNIETIRFYEKQGLLPEPSRTPGGHRVYNTSQVQRLIFIRRARELGFSMAEIRELLSIVDGDHVSCELVKSIAEQHLADVEAKLADLTKMQRTLGDLAEQCSGKDVPDCPILDALSDPAL